MSKFYEVLKLTLVAIASLLFYYFIDNSNYFKSLQLKLDKTNTSWGFEFFLFTNITKYFFLLVGLVAIIFLILRLLKLKNKCI